MYMDIKCSKIDMMGSFIVYIHNTFGFENSCMYCDILLRIHYGY